MVEAVVRFQGDFFDLGPAHLRPLLQRRIAEEITVHEATLSRAASSKYIDTPHGVFPLKHFFPPGIPAANGDLVPTSAVKEDLRTLIAAEDAAHPCSDLALASALRRRGFAVARRTVAKYRDGLAIPPCHQRKGDRSGS